MTAETPRPAGTDLRLAMTRMLEQLVQAQTTTRLAGYPPEAAADEHTILMALEAILLEYRTWLDQDPDPTGP